MLRPLTLALCLASVPVVGNAANLTFTNAGAFAGAAGSVTVESFESLPGSGRTAGVPVVTPILTVSSPSAPIGVQDGPNTPSDGFGAVATDGTHYVSIYRPNEPPGTLTITLAAPARAFGFDLVDVEVRGSHVSLSTDAGAFAGGVILETVAGNIGTGSLRFFGITQDQAFSKVFLTIDGLDDAVGLDNIRVAPVPLPAPALLLGAGLAALTARRRRQPR